MIGSERLFTRSFRRVLLDAMNDPLENPPARELAERLKKVCEPFRGKLTEFHHAWIGQHVSRLRAVFESVYRQCSHDPDEVLDLLTSAGTFSEAYVQAMDDVAATEGYICLAGRNFAMIAIAASYGWKFDEKLSGFANPWPPLMHLFLNGVCATYVIDDSDACWSLTMRVSTSDSDVTVPIICISV